MGPSGSGKSTLLYCLAGILTPNAGEVFFAGQRLDTLDDNERSALRRNAFGFVFQFGQLVPELRADENVALPLLLGGASRRDAIAQAREWLARLDLAGLEDRRAGELSGGQAQRVALARGMVAHPRILFADEPTGSLDSLTGERVMELLAGVAREDGTTVVLADARTSRGRLRRERGDRARRRRDDVDGDDVIRFGCRLALRGGRESLSRLIVMALAVALGVAMLLATALSDHERTSTLQELAPARGSRPCPSTPTSTPTSTDRTCLRRAIELCGGS